jgi:hypothetical protein
MAPHTVSNTRPEAAVRSTQHHCATHGLFVWLVADADLFWEKSTVGWLLVAGLFWEKSTAGWWLISQTNRALSCVFGWNSPPIYRNISTYWSPTKTTGWNSARLVRGRPPLLGGMNRTLARPKPHWYFIVSFLISNENVKLVLFGHCNFNFVNSFFYFL